MNELISRNMAAIIAALVIVVGFLPGSAAFQAADRFPELTTDQRIYDETGTSLTTDEIADLEQQLDNLESVRAYAVLYVRNLMATPEETIVQVESLQQQWAETTGVDQDNAVAILINRNPDDTSDARAGIYVGSTFDDGNVTWEEQEAIISDAMIPAASGRRCR